MFNFLAGWEANSEYMIHWMANIIYGVVALLQEIGPCFSPVLEHCLAGQHSICTKNALFMRKYADLQSISIVGSVVVKSVKFEEPSEAA